MEGRPQQIMRLAIITLLFCQSFVPLVEGGDGSAFSRRATGLKKGRTQSKRPPNIVFILVDDLGFNDVGYHCDGGALIRTPNIDRLAMDGVRLENYYVQPRCAPTRSQLMTGRYQIHTGLQHLNFRPDSPHCLPLHERTIAQALKSAGYSTHAVGKWHLGALQSNCLPTRRGFDSYLGMILGHSNHYNYQKNDGSALFFNENKVTLNEDRYSTKLYTDRAKEIISFHAGAKKPPLFLYVAYQSQHTPLQVPMEYMEQFSRTIADTRRKTYAAMLSVVDEGVLNITQALITHGLWENSIIIFSTDNGGLSRAGGNNWPLRGGKSTLWEGGIRGVAFVSGPAVPKPVRGTVSSELIHVSDWFPTLVHGLAKESSMSYILPLDGFNMWRTISQGRPSPRKELLHNIDPLHRSSVWTDGDEQLWGSLGNLDFNATIRAAIRYRQWKLVTGNAGRSVWTPPPESTVETSKLTDTRRTCIQLFDVQKDPRELINVAVSNPKIVARLLRRLGQLQAGAVPVLTD